MKVRDPFPEAEERRREQFAQCPSCGEWTTMRQLEDWGICEECVILSETKEETE
jgi:hypothetical protein